MKYKALILDLDGTTVQNRIEALPSEKVAQAIGKAKDVIHVCIATSRPLYKALNIINHLKLSGPCITGGGVQIYDPVKREILIEYTLNREVVPRVQQIAKKYNLEAGIFNGEFDHPVDSLTQSTKLLGMYLPVIDPKLVDEIESQMKRIGGVSVHKMPSWEKGHMCLDMTSVRATKLHGINSVMGMLHISKEEVIGVGDSYNDYPLLMASGLKIAMGNAVAEIKAIADFVAPSVDDDGVATVIEKFVLSS
jgi:5-amino-6-(5-phospho-D-ribitylamino)uracil phosphatase